MGKRIERSSTELTRQEFCKKYGFAPTTFDKIYAQNDLPTRKVVYGNRKITIIDETKIDWSNITIDGNKVMMGDISFEDYIPSQYVVEQYSQGVVSAYQRKHREFYNQESIHVLSNVIDKTGRRVAEVFSNLTDGRHCTLLSKKLKAAIDESRKAATERFKNRKERFDVIEKCEGSNDVKIGHVYSNDLSANNICNILSFSKFTLRSLTNFQSGIFKWEISESIGDTPVFKDGAIININILSRSLLSNEARGDFLALYGDEIHIHYHNDEENIYQKYSDTVLKPYDYYAKNDKFIPMKDVVKKYNIGSASIYRAIESGKLKRYLSDVRSDGRKTSRIFFEVAQILNNVLTIYNHIDFNDYISRIDIENIYGTAKVDRTIIRQLKHPTKLDITNLHKDKFMNSFVHSTSNHNGPVTIVLKEWVRDNIDPNFEVPEKEAESSFATFTKEEIEQMGLIDVQQPNTDLSKLGISTDSDSKETIANIEPVNYGATIEDNSESKSMKAEFFLNRNPIEKLNLKDISTTQVEKLDQCGFFTEESPTFQLPLSNLTDNSDIGYIDTDMVGQQINVDDKVLRDLDDSSKDDHKSEYGYLEEYNEYQKENLRRNLGITSEILSASSGTDWSGGYVGVVEKANQDVVDNLINRIDKLEEKGIDSIADEKFEEEKELVLARLERIVESPTRYIPIDMYMDFVNYMEILGLQNDIIVSEGQYLIPAKTYNIIHNAMDRLRIRR